MNNKARRLGSDDSNVAPTSETLRRIRSAISACSSRGLKITSTWLSELLLSATTLTAKNSDRVVPSCVVTPQRGDEGPTPKWLIAEGTF